MTENGGISCCPEQSKEITYEKATDYAALIDHGGIGAHDLRP
jgi:hypothetical protein